MSTSNIYQHRSLRPTGPPSDVYNPARLQDTLDQVKQEFDALANELAIARVQREKYESTINAQVDELNSIRQALYDLEQKHAKVRQQYEEEVRALRADLFASRQTTRPPPQPAVFAAPETHRDRDREDRDRGVGLRDRERGIPDREREGSVREHRDREARERELDRERFLDVQRDAKRIKESTLGPLMGPGSTPALPPPPLPQPAAARLTPTPRMPPRPVPMNDFLADTPDLANVPPQWKKEGSDWFVLYNPAIPRTLDVNLVHTFLHETVVCCVQFSADGKWLATGCNRTAQIFDVQTGHKTCVLLDESTGKTGDLYIRSVRFSPDGKYLATGAEDKRIRIWDIAKRSIRIIFDGHQQEIYSLDFSFDGRLIVSGSGDRTVRIWDMDDRTSRVLSVAPDPEPLAAPANPPTNADAGVTSVAISPDGALVAAGCVDAVVRIWSVATGALVELLRGHQDSVYSVVFTRDGHGIVSGSLDNTLKYWDLRGGKARKEGGKPSVCTTNFLGHKDYVLSVAVSHDAQWVVSGSKDRGVQFWDANGIVQCMLQGHKNSVISISLDPVGNLLASGSGDNLARICASLSAADSCGALTPSFFRD
ncbi:WD40-repeat-containing domain protein [Mycena rosella]|uniref:WD40-repeat-containing domain protein n=1 Tax=Mycena rosella TaxID=1033263 RepID=A0AAD7DPE5_MYCRO|nr:WD40-repeat-containing domain protein [Mycena rosella]